MKPTSVDSRETCTEATSPARFTALERHGQVRTTVIPNNKRRSIAGEISQNLETGAHVYTDSLRSYNHLEQDYTHKVINHAEKYVDGIVHTNGIENFWSLLKRTIKGTYVSVEPFHLFRYLDEQSFRFNKRHDKDFDRFVEVLSMISGKRLEYKDLIGRAAQ
jgi:transposase-like protein